MTALAFDGRSIPAMWSVKPLKAVADYFVSNVDKVPNEQEEPVRLCNYIDVYKNEFIRASSMDFMRSTATVREIERFRLCEGDVVITKDSETWEDIAVPAIVVDSADDLVCGYHLAILRPFTDEIQGRFLFRCLQSKAIRLPLELASTGVTRFGLPQGEIGRLVLPIPPQSVQERIADFLDAQTAEIDALIAEKERMLTLLEEKRAAVVTHAVTRGLDPHVPLKPSGLDWLGKIPDHWRIERLRFHLTQRIEQGCSPQCDNRPAEEDEWGVLKVGCVNGDEFDPNEQKALPLGVEPEVRYEIRKGDILLSRGNTLELVGSATMVPEVRPRLLLSDLLYRCRMDTGRIAPDFAVYQLKSRMGRFQLEREANGTSGSMKKISQETIQDLALLPPIEEQREILAFIRSHTARSRSLRTATNDSLSLLKERRSVLITAAVTGQIPIEEMAA